MNQSKIPVRYAKALFLLGKEKGILGNLFVDIRLLAQFFENTPMVAQWLRSPVIKMQEKKDVFHKQFSGRLSTLTLKFIELVISKKRERYFPDIFRNFIHLHKTEAGIKTYVLTTAFKIDKVTEQKISLILGNQGKTGHELVTRVKPPIIGGFMLQADDLLYDASLSTELKRLKKELTGQVIEGAIIKPES